MAEPEVFTTRPKTKAKIVVSDLHIGEGRRNWDGTLNLLEDFTADSRFVEFVEHYLQAYEEVELVLAGNFFEMLRSRAVPNYPDILFETYALELVRATMDGHPQVLEVLRRFMERENNRLIYLIGEADVGVLWPRVQKEIRQRISERIQFYPNEYLNDGIHIQHGHQYDAMFAIDEYSPFKEVSELPVLKLPWGAFFYANFIQPLRRIRPLFYRVRPMRAYLMWSFLFETRFLFHVIRQFFKMLILATSQKLYPGNSLKDLFKIFSEAADSEVLERSAELLLSSDAVHKVIFGYAHVANYRQFRNGKEYFNTGTWTRNLSLDMRSLGSFHKLSYVLIEYKGETKEPQARLMEWNGKHEVIEDYA